MVETFKMPTSRLIYVFRINDPEHKGAVKIGEATYQGELWPNQLAHDCKELRQAAHGRIKQYTQTAGIKYELVWATPSFFIEGNTYTHFNDKAIHQVLKNSGIKARNFDIAGKAIEWFECDPPTVIKAIEAIKAGRKTLNPEDIDPAQQPIDFRPEQLEAIEMAYKQFKKGSKMLWNAKMRFGKTLSALEVVKRMQFKRTLILTHRPVVNESWFDDFNKIFFDSGGRWIYGSKAAKIDFDEVEAFAKKAEPNSYVYFASMQDLRGSSKAGGKFDKNNALFETEWDFIIVDEAHEGTQTVLGKNVLEELKKKKTKVLHLSGTPFNIQDEFEEEETFSWDYIDEQKAKKQWEIDHPGDYNPYGTLPAMNIYTYDLGKLMNQQRFADKEVAFNFREFFRTDEGGKFVHEDYVLRFLDLLTKNDRESLYPFSNDRFRNIFRHTLWMVPGVREAAALEKLLIDHDEFGAKGVQIVNVAGDMGVTDDDEERRYNNALQKLNDAITDNPFATRTITLSCGRLTTGVSVKPWTEVLMLAGTFNTAASAYMQTIFRVQTPFEFGGLVKDNCYVFDFAPDRTLTVLAEVARVNTKPGKADSEQKERLGEFLNYCSVIALDGSHMNKIDAKDLMERVKKVYIERVVRSGFEDGGLYNDELLKLDAVDVDEFNRIGKAIGRTKAQKGTTEIDVNKQGLTDEEYKKAEEAKKKPKKERTPEDEAAIAEQKKRQEMRQNAISVLRSISIRMPLLIYGAEIDDEKEEITIDNFENLIDTASWDEFMPTCEYDEIGTDGKKRKIKRPLSKAEFRRFKKYYDPDIFIAAAKRIRQMVRNADEMPVEQRISRIADIFSTFRNPDKETVLTPWRVVNMHMSDTLGGYTFLNDDFTETIEEPRFVDRGNVTAEVFNPQTHLLEINSKTGLYPLLLTYNAYRTRLRNEWTSPKTIEEHQTIWDAAVRDNVFVICKTRMAKSITRRTLLGFRPGKANMWAPDDLINKIKNQPKLFIEKVYDLVGKNVKINAIVGNPPYQEEGENTRKAPIYHLFYDIAFKLSSKVTLITPARYLFRAGQTPKDWMEQILSNPHFKVVRFHQKSAEIFDNVDIKGGVAIGYYDSEREFGPIGFFSEYKDLKNILNKVLQHPSFTRGGLANIVSSQGIYRFSELAISEVPAILKVQGKGTAAKIVSQSVEKLPTVFYLTKPKDGRDYIQILGLVNNQRGYRWIRRDYIQPVDSLDSYKVLVPEANGTGAIGEVLSTPVIGVPVIGHTDTFLSIGKFASAEEASACLKYVKTKFARCMLGTLKATQHNPKSTWANVPLLDFTSESDIDWSQSVADIDRQLYAKYGLSEDEIAFIESMIKPM